MAAAEVPPPPILLDTWLDGLRADFEGFTPMEKARERESLGREIDRILAEPGNFVLINGVPVVDNTGRNVAKDPFRVAVNRIMGRGVRGTGRPKRVYYGE